MFAFRHLHLLPQPLYSHISTTLVHILQHQEDQSTKDSTYSHHHLSTNPIHLGWVNSVVPAAIDTSKGYFGKLTI